MRAPLYAIVGLLLMALPAVAAPPYYVVGAFTPSGPGSCTTTSVSVPGTGTYTVNLPDSPGNFRYSLTLNGAVLESGVSSQPGPFPALLPFGDLSNTQPATAMPYTLVATYFPVSGGVNVGTGASVTVVCGVDGVATATFIEGIPAAAVTSAAPVPAIAPMALGVMSALVGLLGFIGFSRRRRQG